MYIKVYFETIEKIGLIFDRKYKIIPGIIKKVFCTFICMFNIIIYKQIDDKIICVLPYKDKVISDNKVKKIAYKIYKLINKLYKLNRKIFLLAFASNIKYKDKFKNIVEEYGNKNILWVDGKWLFNHLVVFIIQYISNIQDIQMQDRRIDILINKLLDISYYNLWSLAKMVKTLKIVTSKVQRFKKIEEKLYEEEGIAIEFSNNIKKALIKSDIIINLDISGKELNKYKINKNAIIIHVNEKNKIESMCFCGVNIYDCNIEFTEEIKDKFKKLGIYNDFNTNILYESYLYKNDKTENIINQIKNDKVEIKHLIGNKGRINDLEFKK